MIAPVVPLTPLGRSTATIGTPKAFIASIIARGSPPTSRSRPAPNKASTTASQFDRDSGEAFFDRATPAICRLRRVALQFRAIAHEAETHLVAALDEVAGGDKSVATVVAGAGHDDDARQLQPGGRFGHGPPGVFHERHAGSAGGDRQAVRLGHFGSRKQFEHRQGT